MNQSQGSDSAAVRGTRRYQSPNRVLVRSFRLGREAWREKHHAVQAKLEQQRQLVAERGQSRDRWRQDCDLATARSEAAEWLAQQRLIELEQARERMAQVEVELAEFSKKD